MENYTGPVGTEVFSDRNAKRRTQQGHWIVYGPQETHEKTKYQNLYCNSYAN